jgi:hypothetical protein
MTVTGILEKMSRCSLVMSGLIGQIVRHDGNVSSPILACSTAIELRDRAVATLEEEYRDYGKFLQQLKEALKK